MSRRVVPDGEPIWRALADPTRRAILDALRDGPRTTGSLVDTFPTSRFTVMEHLGVLVSVGLVTVERRGRTRLNHFNPVPLRQVYDRWVRPLAAASADTLLRLAEVVEGPDMIGMDVRARHEVKAGLADTWRAVLGLPRWWPRRWRDAERLVFEPWVGGRLGPTTTADFSDGVLWGVVTVLRVEQELVLDGGMGMPGPVTGQWRMKLEPVGAHTEVTVEHRVLGPVDDDMRSCYDAGWPETLNSLAEFAEGSGE